MKTFACRPLLSFVVLMVICVAAASSTLAGDNPAVVAGTKKYLAANSYSSAMAIKVEKVMGNYARVLVSPKDGQMDPAIVFLKREQGKWKGLTLGTGWDPAELNKLHIPKSLQP